MPVDDALAMIQALKEAKGGVEKETEDGEDPNNMNPASASSDGNTIYLPRELYDGKCKKGEKITVTGEVVSVGSKIGFMPDEIKKEKDGEEKDEDDDDYDDHDESQGKENKEDDSRTGGSDQY